MSAKKPNVVTISEPKGRPFLQWVGKKPLDQVPALPAQLVEVFDPTQALSPATAGESRSGGNLLFHGDNMDVLAYLLCNGYRGKVNLVYIDPPFDSGADYVRKVELRGLKGAAKLEGESYTLGEQIQYTDIWANDNYLQFMYERLQLLKELMADDGSIYLHCDWHKSHFLRCLMDEIFGAERCLNEVIWKRTSARSDSHTFNHIHDLLLLYSKGDAYAFNQLYLPHDADYIDRYYIYKEPDGRRFATIDATQSGLRKGPSGEPWRGFAPASKGNHWKFAIGELERLDGEGRIYWPDKEGGWPRLKSYLDETKGAATQSIWIDVKAVNSQAEERGDYPTQKPEALLERIINASSNSGDLVLDCFLGSGTTAAVAQKLGRRWIGCDINKGAIQTTSKRLQTIIREQVGAASKRARKLPGLEETETQGGTETSPDIPVYSFSVYRVNDYDLQIQHNEAVQLACEAAHVERTRSDAFFDGVQDDRLVKIVPLNHPCTLLDLELITRELHKRKDDHRDVLVVCLGKETTVDAWVEGWNKRQPIATRSGKKARRINQLEVLELRTSQKYGELFQHDPASATVSVKRIKDKLEVEIENFISPTILKRLKNDQGVLSAKVTDWRSMVDCVLIDTDYDGEVFNICHSDVPPKKTDLVSGNYTLPSPRKGATVAVKLVDMLGEEVLATAKL